MDIVSFNYIFFLLAVFCLYYLVSDSLKKYLLCIASLAFYMIGQTGYAILLLVSILVNYSAGLAFAGQKPFRKYVFGLTLLFNVGLLVYFKYLGYWLSLLNPGLHILSDDALSAMNNLILPLGISFYTFNAIGYTIDTYLSVLKPEHNLAYYITYQAFFPHVLSGPVARAKLLLPQIRQQHILNYDSVTSGLRLILLGYFKKVVIANGLKPYVDAVYGNSNMHNGSTLFIASIVFFCQIYADFSGYTDVALGTAKLFGFNLLNNFNKPFLSRSVTDFWRRWHISLSSWVRDYLYYPIQFKLRNIYTLSVLAATLVTFIVIGMWHGPKTNYLIFGLSQFVFIMAEQYLPKLVIVKTRILQHILKVIQILFTLLILTFSFITLRADTFKQTLSIFGRIFSLPGRIFIPTEAGLFVGSAGFVVLLLMEIVSRQQELTAYIAQRRKAIRWMIYLAVVCMIIAFGDFDNTAFIYYQF